MVSLPLSHLSIGDPDFDGLYPGFHQYFGVRGLGADSEGDLACFGDGVGDGSEK